MKLPQTAYAIGVFGTALILLWVGIFKFTPTEAAAIKPLVANHFAMRWMYQIMSEQTVSNVIGSFEVVTGLGLLLSLFWNRIGLYAGLASVLIFATTLSFLFTTPKSFHSVDGVLITNFFLLKDIPYLAISLMVYLKGRRKGY